MVPFLGGGVIFRAPQIHGKFPGLGLAGHDLSQGAEGTRYPVWHGGATKIRWVKIQTPKDPWDWYIYLHEWLNLMVFM